MTDTFAKRHEVFTYAKALLERGWCRGAPALTRRGVPVLGRHTAKAVAYSIDGAINAAIQDCDADYQDIWQVVAIATGKTAIQPRRLNDCSEHMSHRSAIRFAQRCLDFVSDMPITPMPITPMKEKAA